jgi:gamma-glutamylcysteine synthetase
MRRPLERSIEVDGAESDTLSPAPKYETYAEEIAALRKEIDNLDLQLQVAGTREKVAANVLQACRRGLEERNEMIQGLRKRLDMENRCLLCRFRDAMALAWSLLSWCWAL